ncbi:undecaprenyl diphosphate synthase [Anaeromyxobacter sp. K]|uniref:Isoprenyl transferase n=1 Tax=Anaeromyxobacter dehalogenans (strain ATCC BAA-258 / DSM 21875 / 2CP-1) TaxID=455488 RepID=B8J6S9_ANAD2|nr:MULTISPECIES: polyprenyl diphosphate synthase [Anaeromyxobacter]ACG74863.1 undecaprenyl diphosphate synthase [Anaeromyxobacter sp. K]ACL67051.1 undecaprenyl diphosphate synthase [Anaeromyxobacter dehalogenans 2CP-1]
MADPTVEQLEARVRARPLPRHVAIIMDGNGRWAETRGLPRVAGHREGSEAVRAVTRTARRVGLEALTLYAFSAENWARPDEEVGALMQLLADYLESERAEMMQNGIRLNAIGELDRLPGFVRERLDAARAETAGNDRMVLTLALSYGGRQELVHAARAAAAARGPALDADDLEAALWTRGLPELDLLVRTSGERRISNFLLWQCAYAELYFSEVLWPDFRDAALLEAIASFQARERRFGLTGAQVARPERG